MKSPKILAPAGNKNAFLAAIAAGADAIYCGLKSFSARMEADNFSTEDLFQLCKLAKSRKIDVYIAFNSIIKENELEKVFKILSKLCKYVDFDALIIQDLALIPLARKAGFKKEFHLSTLGNCTFPSGLVSAEKLGIKKVVLPRELNIDEIKKMAEDCPSAIDLEVFVHGALCYSISGRCYWSSWFGGKSALRGRCVQPCRRMYQQKGIKRRHFSCLDFSADVLAKVLKQIPKVGTWKIEGRKKSPHYVYYTTRAYRLLRDDPSRKKEALGCLDLALGREFTHYNLLSQRVVSPLEHSSETGSGLFIGRIKNPASPYFITKEALFPSDLLRIGYEDSVSHDIQRVTRSVPKKGKFSLSKQSKGKISKGTPVYIIDRRGSDLSDAIKALENELAGFQKIGIRPVMDKFYEISTNSPINKKYGNAKTVKAKKTIHEITLTRGKMRQKSTKIDNAMWISTQGYSIPPSSRSWLWLDPLIFPNEEKECVIYISKAIQKGVKKFVLNAPWQISLFKNLKTLNLWAGPYCNITNTKTIAQLKQMGFSGVIVSPELDQDTFLSLPKTSDLPLGVIVYGNWPLGISRIISNDLKPNLAFTSPMRETAWISKRNNNYYIYPNWLLDLTPKKDILKKAGYSHFVSIHESIPKGIKLKDRQGLWNWNLKLL